MARTELPYRKIPRRYTRLRLRPDRGRQEYRKKDEVCFLTKRTGKKESITLREKLVDVQVKGEYFATFSSR